MLLLVFNHSLNIWHYHFSGKVYLVVVIYVN